MNVTIDEVAAHVQLHKGSVSRILSGKGEGYSLRTRQRVLRAAAELGYRPNPTARALATGSTQMVALWLLAFDSYSPYYGYVHHCLQRLGRGHGYQLITENIPFGTSMQAAYDLLMRWPVDGVIACGVPCPEPNSVNPAGHDQPVVYMSEAPGHDFVAVDLYRGGQLAVEHLLAAGCRRVAFVCNPLSSTGMSNLEPRAQAYTDTMRAAGRTLEFLGAESDSRNGGGDAIRAYVTRHGCPDGLYCLNDELAIGCDIALSELGIRVPEDVLLVGTDGLENARLLRCPISSVAIPVEEFCATAWEFLLRRIREPEAALQQRVLAPHLEIRASSLRAGGAEDNPPAH